MVLVRTMVLLVMAAILGLSMTVSSNAMSASATVIWEAALQDRVDALHAEDHCILDTHINHETADTGCCWEMNCAHSSAATLPVDDFVDPHPASGPRQAVAKQITGRNLAPDPGPPKPIA